MTGRTYRRLCVRRLRLGEQMRGAPEGSALRLSCVRQLAEVYRALMRAQR